MKRRNLIISATVIVVILLMALTTILTSCGTGMETATGSLQVQFDNAIRSRLLSPDLSMEPDEYEVRLENGPETFSPETVPASSGGFTFENVFPGDYDITVIARSTGTAIGEGTSAVTVQPGQTNQVTVTINEYTGTGSLSGSVQWQPSVVQTPIFVSYLKDSAGTQTDVTFGNIDAINCYADTSVTPLNNGYYSFICKLYDEVEQPETLSTGFAEIVRIVKDQDTNFDVYLNAEEGEGEIEILFDTSGLNNPLEAAFDVAPGQIDLVPGQTADINIQSVDCAGYTTVWYVTGDQKAVDSDTFSIVADNYTKEVTKRLDLLIFSNDGTRANSYTWEFKVLDVDPLDSYTIASDFWFDDLTNIDQVRIMFLRDNGTSFGVPENSNGDYILADELTAGVPYTYSFGSLPTGEYLVLATVYFLDASPAVDIWSHGGSSFDDAAPEDMIEIPHIGAHLPIMDVGDLD